MLRCAHEIELIETVPRVKLLKVPQQRFDFLTFEELSRLVQAMTDDPERLALVLLGAEAGLRQGETMALEWGDVDLVAGLLTARRSSWKGLIGTPKSGKERKVPLTGRLKAALKAVKHFKSELVLCHSDGKPLTQSAIEAALRFGCKRAGLRSIGSHVLRHTFCSHLAMRGAAPKAIQELVGHSTLTMTLRYMHLAPSALMEAIGLLDFGQPRRGAPDDTVRPTELLQPVGIPAVLAASRRRSSGPYVRICAGLQLAARRSAAVGRRCEPSGVAACRAA